jgi:cardiolipin synthase A/B
LEHGKVEAEKEEMTVNRHVLFTKVADYYADLVAKLQSARHHISMAFLSFDSGRWAEQISRVLISQAASGVRVRLMVDEFGQVLDEPRHLLENIALFHHLRSHGVQVDVYRPRAPLKINNRLHCKFAAIDDCMVYLGGSNIGDYYTTWTDTNLRVEGELGNTFHQLYDFVSGFSRNGPGCPALDTGNLWAGNDRLWLTVPRHNCHIRQALLDLILEADQSIHIRTWYFLPDNEILAALCARARKGVEVNVLLSHETRVRPVDFANYVHVHKLVDSGGHVYRYTGKYMHSKVAWNDHNHILFGSANLDPHSMKTNFESCLKINNLQLARELRHAFAADLATSPRQTLHSYLRRSLADKALTHACNLVSPWM